MFSAHFERLRFYILGFAIWSVNISNELLNSFSWHCWLNVINILCIKWSYPPKSQAVIGGELKVHLYSVHSRAIDELMKWIPCPSHLCTREINSTHMGHLLGLGDCLGVTENVTCSKTQLTDRQACNELLYPLPHPGRLTVVVCTYDNISLG